MKKRKQPKTPKAPIKQPQAVAVSKRSEAPAWGWFKKLGYVGGGLGLILTVLRFWPQLSIEPTAAAERSNPISGYFKIANEQVYPLTDVGIEVSLRCARIGRPQCTLQSSANNRNAESPSILNPSSVKLPVNFPITYLLRCSGQVRW
jgi:hypothetical protein